MGFFFLSEEVGAAVCREIDRLNPKKIRKSRKNKPEKPAFPIYVEFDAFFKNLNYNKFALKTKRKLKPFIFNRQKTGSNLEDCLILILNHLPFTKSDIILLGYKEFFKTVNKAQRIAIEKNKKNG